ncbi:hypothetical protein A0H81_10787 [Grifola frondosa]|uniref:Uncharacterized protein n=1 Tax=Grifola frondosa TaxID=5627 RepID=A0A1C7LYV2_GRIFR|nr:hypothetical protein A0H81_10787 [Grifola frondosa]
MHGYADGEAPARLTWKQLMTSKFKGSYTYTIQYLSSTFHWTSEQLSYWFSLVGTARAVYLMFVLPVAIKLLKPKPPAIQLPVEPAEPLQPSTGPPSPSSSPANPSESPTIRPSHPAHSPSADLKLARASLLIDMAAYVLMPLSTSAALFCTASVVSAFGMGFAPAVQSVALALYTRRGGKESGKLFGALSVVQAMCSQIFGPFLFGVTYAKTVATFPKAIFLLAATVVSLSFVFLALVRLPKDTGDLEGQVVDESTPLLGREETLVEEDLPLILVEDEERGRAVVKP